MEKQRCQGEAAVLSIGMQKCTKNRNKKYTTSLKPVMVNSSVKGGMSHDFMGEIYGHFYGGGPNLLDSQTGQLSYKPGYSIR